MNQLRQHSKKPWVLVSGPLGAPVALALSEEDAEAIVRMQRSVPLDIVASAFKIVTFQADDGDDPLVRAQRSALLDVANRIRNAAVALADARGEQLDGDAFMESCGFRREEV